MFNERWVVKDSHIVAVDDDGNETDIAYVLPPAANENARRIVACYNACRGASTDILENGASHDWALLMSELEDKVERLIGRNDELKAALQWLAKECQSPTVDIGDAVQNAVNVLSK